MHEHIRSFASQPYNPSDNASTKVTTQVISQKEMQKYGPDTG